MVRRGCETFLGVLEQMSFLKCARPVLGPRKPLVERQIAHLICARLEYDLYDFFRGCFGAFDRRKITGSRPKTPLKKSYRSYFRQAQIR